MLVPWRLPIFLFTLFAFGVTGFAQAVSVNEGNVFFTSKDANVTQLTFSGLDSDPSLSVDGRLVIFVRRTPSLVIDAGLGDQDANELWIASTSAAEPPRRVLVGHPGGFKIDENLVLAGFRKPQFSPDVKRVYFVGDVWATSASIRVLDLSTGQVRFICSGLSIEVVPSGRWSGFLIVNKEIPAVLIARIFRYWLLDADGKDVAEIGETENEVKFFREQF